MTEKTQKEKTISTQYAELNRYIANGEHERSLKAANKILGVAPQEFTAFHCKIVSLIQLSKFDEILTLINKNPHFSAHLLFEKAYSYYRLNRHEEALTIIQQVPEKNCRLKELEAQILYRLENYEDAATLYEEITSNVEDEYEDERKTNLSAALVYIADKHETKVDILENTYEICYNKACILISKGFYAEAEKKLRQCEKLCRETLEEEEASDDEIDIDLALIRIQLAYVYQKQGRVKEAHQLYATNLKLKLEDTALIAVASNNTVCINKDQNLFDSKKKMKAALSACAALKLPSSSHKYIALNNAVLHFYLHQSEQCEKACDFVDQKWPDLVIYTSVLRSLNLLKADKLTRAIEILKKIQSISKADKLYINLCVAQLYLTNGKKLEACKVLENLGEDSYRPGIVGALTTLYLGLNDEDTALKVFEKTVDWYKKNKVKEVDLTNVWRQAAEFHIKNGHPQVAANSLEELLKTNPDDKKIIAQLVLALSQFDKARALKLSKKLPSIEELSKGIDIEALQNMSSSTSVNVRRSPATKQESQPGTPKSDNIEKKRKNKKRKGKLPINCDPNVPADPERWLPRYERTGFRKKRDRRMKEVNKGSQGTASGQAEQYDFTSKHMEQESQESSPVVEPSLRVKGGQQQQAKKIQKKRNKRR